MRLAAGSLALAVALSGTARAQAPHFDIIPSMPIAISGQPFNIDVHLVGTLDAEALQIAAVFTDGFVDFTLSIDGAALPYAFGLAFYQLDPGIYPGSWRYPRGWQATGVTLSAGLHSIVASYGGDTVNPAMSTRLSMAVLQPVTLGGGQPGDRLTPHIGVLPGVLPIGRLTLKDITTGVVTIEDISEFLVVDPLDQSLHLDLGRLKDDTLVSFPGDANFAPLSFTYDAQDVPEPAGLLAVGTLGAIWAARRRAIRPA